MYLDELDKNECAQVVLIKCPDSLKSRLSSFGVVKNSLLQVLEKTLSKNNIEIKVANTKIALRDSEAKQILVKKIPCKN